MRYRGCVRSLWPGAIGATAAIALTAACGHVEMPGPDAQTIPDAPTPDAPTPDAPSAAPMVVDHNVQRVTNDSILPVTLTVKEGAARYLLVSVAIGSSCSDTSVATVTSVTYGSVALERIAQIVGTKCSATATRSEQWGLVAPAVGTSDVVVTLSARAASLHVGVLDLTGINQAMPVRKPAAVGSGNSSTGTVSVMSDVGDLVVSTVGDGDSILGPGGGQTQEFTSPGSGSNTLDNAAASTAAGASPMVLMDWTFGIADEWQMIVSSLRPQ